jgi:hypothetical protein
MKTYSGLITHLEPHQIFVFGSNSQGKHGAGAALWALKYAGAIYGQPSGRQGQSYAIITKDLRQKIHPSVSEIRITNQITNLYGYAINHPELDFMISYGVGKNLNGYTPEQMAIMFKDHIPDNIVFNKEFAKLL